jgi:predicted ATPase/DNA-binding SARP family transcriptional activator/DNA-binding CsgD family transcriptional regulator
VRQDHTAAAKVDPLRIYLLGGFRVTVDSRTVDDRCWGRRKARSLVKLLALAPGQRLHHEQALEALWPHLAPAAARNSLHGVLHLARGALARGSGARCPYLRLQNEMLFLGPSASLWIDVGAFQHAAATARRTRDSNDYEAAVALYGGDLLPEDRYEDWAADRREELQTEYLNLLRDLARVSSARGDEERAATALQQLVDSEPTDEVAHIELAQAYARMGRHEGAIEQYRRLERVLQRELGVDPSPASRRFYQALLAESSPPPLVSAPGRPAVGRMLARHHSPSSSALPQALSSLIGRDGDVLAVAELLGQARLVTLTGPGGIGKTRVALAAAAATGTRYPDGVHWVALEALRDSQLVVQEIARTLEVRAEADRPLEQTLVDTLRHRRMLLVLDNCEHLLGTCASLAGRLLEAAPGLRVLTTSRELLGIAGEQVWAVPPLALPPAEGRLPLDQLRATASVRLFLERAGGVQPAFELTAENAGAVVQICRRLDGLPLAIELAAAWASVLAPAQIAARLDDRFHLLTLGSRTAPPRQQTLRAALDWTHALLAEDERVALRRVAVFAGGFTLEAAQRVCVGDDLSPELLLPLLARLSRKSLIVADTRGTDARYRLPETIREYALLQLATHDDPAPWRARHAQWCLELAEESEPELFGPEQLCWLDRLEREIDNLRAALAWGSAQGGADGALRLAAALWWFWQVRGYVGEGCDWLERLLERGSTALTPARAKALVGAGVLLWRRGETSRAVVYETEGLVVARHLEDPRAIGLALHYLGMHAHGAGDCESAAALLTEAVGLWRQGGPAWRLAASLARLAVVLDARGAHARAATLLDEARALEQQLGHYWGLARTSLHRGELARKAGNSPAALASLQESLQIFRTLVDGWGVVNVLVELGELALASGDHARANELLEEALTLERRVPSRQARARALRLQATAARASGQGAAAAALFEAWLACCVEVGDEQGAAAARDALASCAGSVAERWAGLSRREREVAVLVARGCTDRQIAATLRLAVRTAETHVWHGMRKLGCTSRSQVAALVNTLHAAEAAHGR